MLIAAAILLAQVTTPNATQYDPEIEALLRRRDEQRRAEALQTPVDGSDDRAALTAVVPPAIAERLASCLASANIKPADGITAAQAWAREGGGAYAAQCHGYALGLDKQWTQAAAIFEAGAKTKGIDAVMRARLLSQAGNAELIAGNSAAALRALDEALAQPLPRTLSTGEIHLDRARARVAANDLPGARTDLNQAITLAAADPLTWLLSATLARRMNDLPLARQHIEEAAKRARNDAPIALEQGIIYALSGGDDPAAIAAFTRAQELAGPTSEVGKQAADYLVQLGQTPKAETKVEATR